MPARMEGVWARSASLKSHCASASELMVEVDLKGWFTEGSCARTLSEVVMGAVEGTAEGIAAGWSETQYEGLIKAHIA